MWYLHIHFVWDRLSAWFAMGRLSGPVCPEQTHFTPFGGRPRARAEPSTRTRIAGGFLWARAARPQAHEPATRYGDPDGRRIDGNI